MATELTADKMIKLSEYEAFNDKGRRAMDLRRPDLAKDFFAKAQTARIAALGENDPGVAEIMNERGRALSETGDFDGAHALFSRALEILTAAYYEGHYKLAPVYRNQADCYLRQEKLEEAEASCLKAHEIFSKTLTGEHRNTIEATYALAHIYFKLGKHADALKLFTKAKKAIESPLGPLEEFKFLEARIHDADAKPELAEAAYAIALSGFRQRRHFRMLSTCLDSYSDFLARQGKKEASSNAAAESAHYKELGADTSRNDEIFTATLLKA